MATGTATIAADWRKHAVSPMPWTPCENQAGATQGEAGGYFVSTPALDRRAYLKPANAHHDKYARAAREKIASDLAYELGLPVPPALLTERPDPPEGCERFVVVSLVMYPCQWAWEQVQHTKSGTAPHDLALAKTLAACSPMVVFDTWLAQTDHGDHPHNVVWGYDPNRPEESEIVFLDYAFSMGFSGSWNDGQWGLVDQAPFPRRILEHRDAQGIQDLSNRIEAFDEALIREIVERIPRDYLSAAEAQAIAEGLIGRRSLVAARFKQQT